MIKIILTSICVTFLAMEVYAQDIIFPDELLNEIRVIETDKEEGKAVVIDGDGNQMEVSVDDVISIDAAVVIEIETGHITVKRGDTRTRMLVVPGF
jgi:hypothetical protein